MSHIDITRQKGPAPSTTVNRNHTECAHFHSRYTCQHG